MPKMFSVISIRKRQVKNHTINIMSHTLEHGKRKECKEFKYWWRWGETRALISLSGSKIIYPFWKWVWEFFRMLKTVIMWSKKSIHSQLKSQRQKNTGRHQNLFIPTHGHSSIVLTLKCRNKPNADKLLSRWENATYTYLEKIKNKIKNNIPQMHCINGDILVPVSKEASHKRPHTKARYGGSCL